MVEAWLVRLTGKVIPEEIAARMRPEDRERYGIITAGDAVARGEAREAVEEETELQGACEGFLGRKDVAALHLSLRAREKKGWPDLTFTWHGVPMAVELKSRTGKLKADQIRVLKQMKRNGCNCFVIRNYDDFRELLELVKCGKLSQTTQWSLASELSRAA